MFHQRIIGFDSMGGGALGIIGFTEIGGGAVGIGIDSIGGGAPDAINCALSSALLARNSAISLSLGVMTDSFLP